MILVRFLQENIMKKHTAISICTIVTSLIFSVSVADTIYCPTEINGNITHYDDQWKLSATYIMGNDYTGQSFTVTSSFEPPLTLKNVPTTLDEIRSQAKRKTSVVFKTMNFTFNQGIDVETFPSMSKKIKLICKATPFTAVEERRGWIYTDPEDWEGSITAEKVVTNYSVCTILSTVPASFDCN